jgi:hypothetical protein
LEKAIWGILAGRKANEARGSEKKTLPHFFPRTHRFESFEEKSLIVFHPARLRSASAAANMAFWPFFVNFFLSFP